MDVWIARAITVGKCEIFAGAFMIMRGVKRAGARGYLCPVYEPIHLLRVNKYGCLVAVVRLNVKR